MHFFASATVTKLFKSSSTSSATPCTALITSDNLPTPDGSMMIRSGLYCVTTSFNALPKSPTKEQQIHPEFISVTSIPASLRNPPSIPISPNSFSISTTFSPFNASFNNFWIRVVLPAPKNPDMISIFAILYYLPLCSILIFPATLDFPFFTFEKSRKLKVREQIYFTTSIIFVKTFFQEYN